MFFKEADVCHAVNTATSATTITAASATTTTAKTATSTTTTATTTVADVSGWFQMSKTVIDLDFHLCFHFRSESHFTPLWFRSKNKNENLLLEFQLAGFVTEPRTVQYTKKTPGKGSCGRFNLQQCSSS